MKNRIFYFCITMLSFAMISCNDDTGTQVTGVNINLDQVDAVPGGGVTLLTGQTLELTATVEPRDATNNSVIWESSDPAIADVSSAGLVTAIAAGKVVITATTEDGGHKAECDLTVEEFALSHHAISLELDDEFTLTTNAGDAGTITWESRNPTLVTVTNDGVVKAIATGITTVVAKLGDFETSVLVSAVEIPTIRRCVEPAEGWFESLGQISFKSDRTWTVGKQEWSDAVMAANVRTDTNDPFFNGWHEWCEDPTHDHPMFYCDARANMSRDYGDLFSWCTVAMYRKQLCPDGWRVPSSHDFRVLNIALGGRDVGPGQEYVDATGVIGKYIDDWGAELGSVCNNSIFLTNTGNLAGYWAINEYDDREAFMVEINQAVNKVMPEPYWLKNYGMSLRCVRDVE